jgi:ABC-type phosphate transport system substrate-binding protein
MKGLGVRLPVSDERSDMMARVSVAHRRGAARSLVLVLVAASGGLFGALPARATAAVTLRVVPGRALVAGQWVTASWTGVASGTPVYLRQCTLNPVTIRDCSYLGSHALHNGGIAPDTGEGSLIFPVSGVLNAGNTIDRFACDDAHACSIALFTDPTATNLNQAVLDPISFAVSSDTCPQPLSTDEVVSGQGTFTISRAFRSWEGRLCRTPHNLEVKYHATSSLKGEAAFVNEHARFAMTSQPLSHLSLTTLESQHRRFAYAPMVGSGLAFGFRMLDPSTGRAITTLKVTPKQLALIFTGQLQDLGSDADIVAQNPGVTFPPVVQAIGRADPSPQTQLLTSWFLSVARRAYRDGGPAFRGRPTDTYPNSGTIRLLTGAKAVAAAVGAPHAPDPTQFGTIGWMDSSVAAMYDLPTVLVENHSGAFVAPTSASIAAAIRDMGVNPDGVTRFPRFLTSDARAYPLPVVTYMVAQTSVTQAFDKTEADVLRGFIRLVASSVAHAHTASRNGGLKLPEGYARLPAPMTTAAGRAANQLPTRSYVAPGSQTPTGTGFGSGGGGPFTGGTVGGNGSSSSFGSGSQTSSVPSGSPTDAPSVAALPPYTLVSANGGYVWPVVLVAGLGLLVLGTLLSVALGLASRHGAKKALAAAAAGANGPGPVEPARDG